MRSALMSGDYNQIDIKEVWECEYCGRLEVGLKCCSCGANRPRHTNIERNDRRTDEFSPYYWDGGVTTSYAWRNIR